MDAQKHPEARKNALFAERRILFTGLATFVVGVALLLFGSDNHVILFTPSKLGLVLVVIGGLEIFWALFKGATRR